MTANYVYTPNLWPSIATVFFLLGLYLYGWVRRKVPGAFWFGLGSLFAALWSTGAILEYASTEVTTKVFWMKFHVIFQLPTITAITFFVLEYAQPGRWITRRNVALLSIAPLLTFVLVVTNEGHHLVWRSNVAEGLLSPAPGPALWLLLTYSYALGVVFVVVLAKLFLRSPQQRWPVALMLTGQIAARTIYALEAGNVVHADIPLDVLAIAIAFFMYALALFAFHIFDPILVARQMAIDQLHAGVVVVDANDHVTTLNPAAARFLNTSSERAVGRPLSQLLPAYANDRLRRGNAAATEIELATGTEPRHCALSISSLTDWYGQEAGELLLIQDISEQKLAQAQLVKQQQAQALLHERERLARELHDTLGQVCAFVNAQGQTVQRLLARGEVTKAMAHVERMVEVTRRADVDIRESILGLRASLSEEGLLAVLVPLLTQYEKNYGIQASLDMPEELREGAFEPLVAVQLVRILQEALTNVRKHAVARSVRISFTADDDFAIVAVTDDGVGFDPSVRVDDLSEHFGLRVMAERAAEIGGSLSLQTAPGQGATMVVQVPLKRSSATDKKELLRDGNRV